MESDSASFRSSWSPWAGHFGGWLESIVYSLADRASILYFPSGREWCRNRTSISCLRGSALVLSMILRGNRVAKRRKSAIAKGLPEDAMSDAEVLARWYQRVLWQIPSDVRRSGRLLWRCKTVELELVSVADTPEEALEESLLQSALVIVEMRQDGIPPPEPLAGLPRDQQVNIRLTAEERLTLESLANREGFRSVSDYVRSAALGRTSPRR